MKYIYNYLVVFFIIIALSSTLKAQPVTRTVTDQMGRKVTFLKDPRRLVALAPSITEVIFALEQEDRLKGVTRFSDFPPQAANLPKVGSYVHLDLEKIVALKPDLCIAIKDGNPKEVVDRLESLNIPVYAVDPRNLEAVMETMLEIGGLLNADKKAKFLVQRMHSRVQRVQSMVAKADHRPRVFFQIGISPIVSVGTHTFIHELILLAGGQNILKSQTPYPRLSKEQVIALSPEIIIITSMARGEIFERVKKQWQSWPNLPAVRNRRIFLVDSDLFDRPTPRIVDGLELLGRLLHPKLFKETE